MAGAPRVFAVRSEPAPHVSKVLGTISRVAFVAGPLAGILVAQLYQSNCFTKFESGKVCLLAVLLVAAVLLLGRSESDPVEARVTIFPLGAQLEIRQRDLPVSRPVLIVRDEILDVIVKEVILAHKVVSVLMFRVLKTKSDVSSDTGPSTVEQRDISIQKLLEDGQVQLVPAFPGVELSYSECQSMRRGISHSLGLG